MAVMSYENLKIWKIRTINFIMLNPYRHSRQVNVIKYQCVSDLMFWILNF
jgi:hypothetical protein